MEPSGGWLALREFGVGKDNISRRAERWAARPGVGALFDLTVPVNQRKLEIVTELSMPAAEAGLTLVEMALAFVLEHPAVSAAIIGPRTMEQLETQLSAPEIRLESVVLDRIDEIVPPGTDVNPEDIGRQPPALQASARRRHHLPASG